jgi:hypothetical protein
MELTNTEPMLDIHAPERAVFVTDDNRRARRLRRAAYAVTAVACLWLVGLGVGMFGLGGLPGISLGKNGGGGADAAKPDPSLAQLAPVARSFDHRASVAAPTGLSQRTLGLQSRSSRARARTGRPVSNPPVSNPAPPAAQQPVNPAGRERGWARQGHEAPPGQVRRTQPPPPPPSSQGQHRGQTERTVKPAPPGQAKKTPAPPPPPPEG